MMKLSIPIGLSLVTAVYGYKPSDCESVLPYVQDIDAHCEANPGLGEYCLEMTNLQVCPDSGDDDEEETDFSDNSLGANDDVYDGEEDDTASDSMIIGRSGGRGERPSREDRGSQMPQWVKDVFMNCRETRSCRKNWTIFALPRLVKFIKAIDSSLATQEPERYSDFMDILNTKCYETNQQCESPIYSFNDMTVPTYDNNFSTECIKCTIIAMRSGWEVTHTDVTLSGVTMLNCMGPFCRVVKEMKAKLAAKIKNEGGAGKYNNALSSDIGNFHSWKHKHQGKKEEGSSSGRRRHRGQRHRGRKEEGSD